MEKHICHFPGREINNRKIKLLNMETGIFILKAITKTLSVYMYFFT